MLTRAQKQDQIDALKVALGPAQGVFVMDFTGLSVGDVTELRDACSASADYVVVKNTLAKIALSGAAGIPAAASRRPVRAGLHREPTRVQLAKALAEFAKTHDKLGLPRRVREGQLLTRLRPAGRDVALEARSWWPGCCSCCSRRSDVWWWH